MCDGGGAREKGRRLEYSLFLDGQQACWRRDDIDLVDNARRLRYSASFEERMGMGIYQQEQPAQSDCSKPTSTVTTSDQQTLTRKNDVSPAALFRWSAEQSTTPAHDQRQHGLDTRKRTRTSRPPRRRRRNAATSDGHRTERGENPRSDSAVERSKGTPDLDLCVVLEGLTRLTRRLIVPHRLHQHQWRRTPHHRARPSERLSSRLIDFFYTATAVAAATAAEDRIHLHHHAERRPTANFKS